MDARSRGSIAKLALAIVADGAAEHALLQKLASVK
jgi:hypothetical protein